MDEPRLVGIFRQALFDELYSCLLFEKEKKDYYLFQPQETGESVWLVPLHGRSETYEPRLFGDEVKRPSAQVIPRSLLFQHDVSFDVIMLEDRGADIERMIAEGGRRLAETVNRRFIDVLMTAAADRASRVHISKVMPFLAELADRLTGRGFNADRLLLPKGWKNRLSLAAIRPDGEFPNPHYMGRTDTGLKAFWSSELPDNTALVFDSTAGVVIGRDPEFRCGRGEYAFHLEVGARLEANLVIKNVQAVAPIAIGGTALSTPMTCVEEVSVLLDRGIGTVADTLYFANKGHAELVEEFHHYLEMHRSLIGAPHIEVMQAPNDRGTDVLLERADCRVGFQIKSHYDVRQDDFAASVKRQLTESYAHGLDKWYLLICSPLQDDNHDYTARITSLLNELSALQVGYVAAYGPRNTIKYFNSPAPLSREEFDRTLRLRAER